MTFAALSRSVDTVREERNGRTQEKGLRCGSLVTSKAGRVIAEDNAGPI